MKETKTMPGIGLAKGMMYGDEKRIKRERNRIYNAGIAGLLLSGIAFLGVIAFGTYMGPDNKCSKKEQKPTKRVEYREVNQDNRQDVVISFGEKKYIFLQNPNGDYVLSNLEKSVQELNEIGREK